MKSNATILAALVAGAHAQVPRDSTCCFQLNATGGPGGPVGQLSDGQNRIGQGLPSATYCLNNDTITDASGRGCILTSPTTQLQCDVGATPSTGFAIDCNSELTHSGSSAFSACPTGDNGGYNIYTSPPPSQSGCVNITLSSGSSCHSACPVPAPAPKACPLDLAGTYEYPHLIVPISASNPDRAYGTSYFGELTSDLSSIFNFDIPPADSGKTCSLIFLLNESNTSNFTLFGTGELGFVKLNGSATTSTTWNSAPKVETDYGSTTVARGGAYRIATFDCPSGQTVAYEISSRGGTSLDYFQDYNAPGSGLYITVC